MGYTYKRPTILREWTLDIQGGELYMLYIRDDQTVVSAVGRYAHSSGSSQCSWDDFLGGKFDDLVIETMGIESLNEAKSFICNYQTPSSVTKKKQWWKFW